MKLKYLGGHINYLPERDFDIEEIEERYRHYIGYAVTAGVYEVVLEKKAESSKSKTVVLDTPPAVDGPKAEQPEGYKMPDVPWEASAKADAGEVRQKAKRDNVTG
jgi:hypothetical protein